MRLYDFRNRLYQPELGRFLQPDPKQFEAGDYNLYRYCHNDPVNHTDPDGTERIRVDVIWKMAKEADSGHRQDSLTELANAANEANRANAIGRAFSLENLPPPGSLPGDFENHEGELKPWEAIVLAVATMRHPENRGFGRALRAKPTVGTKLFRVWGDGSEAMGPSWTTVDPRTVPNYRNAAGLPAGNSGRFLSEGVLRSTQRVTTRDALPLHGNVGGLPEVRLSNPVPQIRLENVQGLNPEF
jgi:uncharacterized protein RhaS with RHS repeats